MRACAKCKELPVRRYPVTSILCEECAVSHDYSSNTYGWIKGSGIASKLSKDVGLRFGFELELTHDYPYDNNGYESLVERLILAGFLRTRDPTVSDELKSPVIICGYLPSSWDKLLTKACHYTQDSSVGTHVHMSHSGVHNWRLHCRKPSVINAINTLGAYLVDRPTQTEAVWGRSFVYHASYPFQEGDHDSWISNEHSGTIEYRLCRMVNVKQFRALIAYLARVTDMLSNTSLLSADEPLLLYKRTFGDVPAETTHAPISTATNPLPGYALSGFPLPETNMRTIPRTGSMTWEQCFIDSWTLLPVSDGPRRFMVTQGYSLDPSLTEEDDNSVTYVGTWGPHYVCRLSIVRDGGSDIAYQAR